MQIYSIYSFTGIVVVICPRVTPNKQARPRHWELRSPLFAISVESGLGLESSTSHTTVWLSTIWANLRRQLEMKREISSVANRWTQVVKLWALTRVYGNTPTKNIWKTDSKGLWVGISAILQSWHKISIIKKWDFMQYLMMANSWNWDF